MQKMVRLGLAGLLAATILSVAPAAFASHNKGVTRSGPCSAASTWKLKLSNENQGIQVEFEVDQNVNGDTWKVQMADNGTVFFKGRRTTAAPSGSFEVRKLTANQAGTDRVVAKAMNLTTGETCTGKASI